MSTFSRAPFAIVTLLVLLSASCGKQEGSPSGNDGGKRPDAGVSKESMEQGERPSGQGGGEVSSSSSGISNVETVPELSRWLASAIGKRVLTSEERADLVAAILRLAESSGKEPHVIAGEMLKSMGDKAILGASELVLASVGDPAFCTRSLAAGLEGREHLRALSQCVSIYTKSGDTGSLQIVYDSANAGPARSAAAGALVNAIFAKEGVPGALSAAEALEYPEERQVAILDLCLKVKQEPADRISPMEIEGLIAVAKKEGLEVPARLHFEGR